jgi:phage terminase large subunit-like protein
MARLSESTKALEALISTGGIEHNNNPVANWMIKNAVAKYGQDGASVMLHKKKSAGKIDGLAALVDAYTQVIVAEDDTVGEGIMIV